MTSLTSIDLRFCFSAHSRLAILDRSAASSLADFIASSFSCRSRTLVSWTVSKKVLLRRICFRAETSPALDVTLTVSASESLKVVPTVTLEMEVRREEFVKRGGTEKPDPIDARFCLIEASDSLLLVASCWTWAALALLVAVSRGRLLGPMLCRKGRALNSLLLLSSSACALIRASLSSRLRLEIASPGSSKHGLVRVRGLEGDAAILPASSCCSRLASRCSFKRLATASPGSSKLGTVGGFADLLEGGRASIEFLLFTQEDASLSMGFRAGEDSIA